MTPMTRLLALWTRRRTVRPHIDLTDAGRQEPGSLAGWYESSRELEHGLTVLEDPDTGPETRPFSYLLEEEAA